MNDDCKNAYALPFATWELRLYLDTHPNDRQVLALYHKFCGESQAPNYACLPVCAHTAQSGNCCPLRWTWIDDPWPWEPSANQPAREV